MKKTIHYCWFGRNPKPALIIKCMESWKKFCPDYEIIEWNEDNFDINCCAYVREAYEAKKWAFVSDYVRCYVLYNYGGKYLDTDVQLVQSPDEYMNLPFFCSIEGDIIEGRNIPEPAVMGGQKGHIVFKEILDFYNSDDIFKLNYPIANVVLGKYLFDKINFQKIEYKNEYYEKLAEKYYDKNIYVNKISDFDLYTNQLVYKDENNGISIYPSEYFCPTWDAHCEKAITKNTVAIHWNQSSWWKDYESIKNLFAKRYNNKFRQFLFKYSERIAKLFTFFIPHKFIRKRLRNNIKKICEK